MKKLVSSVFSTAICLAPFQFSDAQQKLPNVVFIMADDMGIGDAGCYGQKIIKTPNIDKLAASGVQFMQHYSGSTVSAPSRCAMLTGKHTGHAYVRGNKTVVSESGTFDLAIPASEVTVAELFKQKGYATACVGKWGLGGPQTEGSPVKQGFDYFFGYLGQAAAHRYYPEFLFENEDKYPLNGQYSHYLIVEKGLEFIKENAGKPFFAYFAITPPHADLDIPDLGVYNQKFPETPYFNPVDSSKVSSSFKGYKTQLQPKAAYAAMVSEVDRTVGQVVALLKEKGILDNTIIIFTSDNGVHNVGGNDPDFFDSNGPFRGIKRDLYEGGIHTPFIVSWKDKIPESRYSYHVSTFWDFLPTVAELIGVKNPAGINGISYLPELLGNFKKQKQHTYIYHEFHELGGKQSLIRSDGWKLIRLQVNNPKKLTEELYNIYNDPSETANVIKQYPAIAQDLRVAMKKERLSSEHFEFK